MKTESTAIARSQFTLQTDRDVLLPKTYTVELVKRLYDRLGLPFQAVSVPAIACSGLLGPYRMQPDFFCFAAEEPYQLVLSGLDGESARAIADLDLSPSFDFSGDAVRDRRSRGRDRQLRIAVRQMDRGRAGAAAVVRPVFWQPDGIFPRQGNATATAAGVDVSQLVGAMESFRAGLSGRRRFGGVPETGIANPTPPGAIATVPGGAGLRDRVRGVGVVAVAAAGGSVGGAGGGVAGRVRAVCGDGDQDAVGDGAYGLAAGDAGRIFDLCEKFMTPLYPPLVRGEILPSFI